LYGLGNVYLSQGDLDLALEYHRRCLTQWSQTLGTSHHRIGDVSLKLAQDLMGQGNLDMAQCVHGQWFSFMTETDYSYTVNISRWHLEFLLVTRITSTNMRARPIDKDSCISRAERMT
jgi:hypothetical protein